MKKQTNYLMGLILGLGLCDLATGAVSPAQKGACLPNGNGVEFEAIGKPSLLKIVGKGKPVDCEVSLLPDSGGSKLVGKFRFSIESLDTGIELRNKHMKEKYLEVGKFPTAELEIKELKFKSISDLGSETAFAGTLLLHGVSKEIQGTFSVKGDEKEANGEARFEVSLKDFGVAIPSFAGITVSETVKVRVPVSVRKQ